jgi:hypothetical protein
MRRIALLLVMTTALLGAGTLGAPAFAEDYTAARAYAPQQAAHQEVDYAWDFTNSCNSIRLRLTPGFATRPRRRCS